MKKQVGAWLGAMMLGLLATPPGSARADVTPPPAPFSRLTYQRLQAQPDLLRRLMFPTPVPRPATAPPPAGSPWAPLATQPPFNPGAMLLLTDGTVLVQDAGASNASGASNWWRLTPDKSGSYLHGTWTQRASMPAGYAPLYFASAVLPDGRLLVEGGEYINGSAVWSSLGAIYTPTSNTWKSVSPPAGMTLTSGIGDAQSTVLANGRFMLSPVYIPSSGPQQLFNASTLTWTASGGGKAGGNDEESQVLLPNGKVLNVDINYTPKLDNSELYDPATGRWSSAGSTKVTLFDKASSEIGPHLMRPNGTVLAVGATKNNAVYDTSTKLWSAGPSFPSIGGQQYDVADGPAAVLPSGNVLIMASPGIYKTPSHFFLFNGTTLTRAVDPPNAASLSSYYGYMLVLPTGQIMFNSRFGDVELYTDTGKPSASWLPVVTGVPAKMGRGGSYVLSGKQLSGRSQGAGYGDDYQSATNFPVVRITNNATRHVAYARTYGHTSMSVAANAASSTHVQIPSGIETGASTLVVVASGLASTGTPVTITATPADTALAAE